MSIAALFTIANLWKQPIYKMEYYSAMKKKEILLFGSTRMNLEGIMLSEKSQIEKDKYWMVSPKCEI